MVATSNNNNNNNNTIKSEFGKDMFSYGELEMVKEGKTKYLMKSQGLPEGEAEAYPLKDFVKGLLWKIALANCDKPRDYLARQIKPAPIKDKKIDESKK